MGHKLIIGNQVFEYNDYNEYLEAINQLNPNYIIDENKFKVEQSVDNFVIDKLSQYWYKDLSDLLLIANTPESIWYDEANIIKTWYNDVYEHFYNYKISVTEKTLLTPDDFIKTLPELIVK